MDINADLEKRLQAFEVWFWTRMLNISGKKKLTNERVGVTNGWQKLQIVVYDSENENGIFWRRHDTQSWKEKFKEQKQGEENGKNVLIQMIFAHGQIKRRKLVLLGSLRTEKVSYDFLPSREMELHMT